MNLYSRRARDEHCSDRYAFFHPHDDSTEIVSRSFLFIPFRQVFSKLPSQLSFIEFIVIGIAQIDPKCLRIPWCAVYSRPEVLHGYI